MHPRWAGGIGGIMILAVWLAADQLLEPGISIIGLAIGTLIAIIVGAIIAIIWTHDVP